MKRTGAIRIRIFVALAQTQYPDLLNSIVHTTDINMF